MTALSLNRLPQNFAEFTARGPGCFDDFLWVLSVDGPTNLSISHRGLQMLDSLAGLGLRRFPEEEGLLSWGFTDNGDVCCWITDGRPASWATVFVSPRDGDIYRTAMTFGQILDAFGHGRRVVPFFPDDFPGDWEWVAHT